MSQDERPGKVSGRRFFERSPHSRDGFVVDEDLALVTRTAAP